MTRDPIELLASLNPMPRLNETLPGDEAMLASITASSSLPASTRRRRHWGWVVVGSTVAALGLAAFAILRQDSPANPTTIVCYTNAAVPPDAMHVLEVSDDPVDSCATLWRNGVIARGDPPELHACLNNAGTIAVIPGDSNVCSTLGFSNWVGAFSTDELQLINFQEEVTEWFGTQCIPESDAIRDAHRFVDRLDDDGWTVVNSGNWSSQRPCAASGVDPATKTVSVGGRRPHADGRPSTT